MKLLTKIFGNYSDKYLKEIQPEIEKINSLEPEFEKLSEEELKQKTKEFKERFKGGESLDSLLSEAFALVREAAKRTLNQRHFDVQLIGGIVLHQGKIAEMKTGEGKTLAATLSLYLNALEGKGCHLVTVNDYLAKRDTVWMGQIYHALGLSVGCIMHDVAYLYDPTYQEEDQGGETKNQKPDDRDKKRDVLGSFKVVESYLRPVSRKEVYSADITYGTNNEFGFDYLRDNMAYSLDQQAQRGFNYAIVDEVDSILIDEARTPLIISAPDTEASNMYREFSRITPRLKETLDYTIDEKQRTVILTEEGIEKVEKILGLGNIYEEKGIRYVHHLEEALRADFLFKKDKDYVIKDGQVIIIDEFTGRLMPGRRWSGGLHQAIEAKEGMMVQPESLTLASITFQNYFRLYKTLAGMTGTALTSAEEFDKVYELDVIPVPTHKPMIRMDPPDKVYKTEKGKFEAVVKEIKERYERGQPILVGTKSVEKNEYMGKLLEKEGISHQILNAKNHEREGEIIAQAGRMKAVTVATNMAGRGVDIVLGGNPQDPEQSQRVLELGGLHVISTERHEARRIDNQLRGRSGRQGDTGSSQFFVSLEDELLRVFGGEKIKSLMGLLKIPEDQPIEAGMISSAIENAQSKIEGFNFDIRKHVLEYDDVLNKHRGVIYKKRREILKKAEVKNPGDENSLRSYILEIIKKHGYTVKEYEQKEEELSPEKMREVEKFVSLRTLDMLWMNHLEEMEHLRDSVRLRAYGQQDPLIEYKNEGHKTFKNLLLILESNIAHMIFKAQITEKHAQPAFVSQPVSGISNSPKIGSPTDLRRPKPTTVGEGQSSAKVGRNDPCPCGAKKPDGRPIKYKRCHGE